jgi:hypothetical protein
MVPFATAIENKNAGPTKEINKLVLKFDITVLSGIPPNRAMIRAAPIARKPIFTFFQNPSNKTATRNTKEIAAR